VLILPPLLSLAVAISMCGKKKPKANNTHSVIRTSQLLIILQLNEVPKTATEVTDTITFVYVLILTISQVVIHGCIC
jgi:hypothetical protein